MVYDVIVIGAGPAGVSAAIQASKNGCRVLVLEKEKVGAAICNISTITLFLENTIVESGEQFANILLKQILDNHITVKYQCVDQVELSEQVKVVCAGKARYEANAIIIANGTQPRKLGIPGEVELWGKGIGLNVIRDGMKYKGKNIYVVGSDVRAIKEAMYLAQFAKKLTVICYNSQLDCPTDVQQDFMELSNTKIKYNTRITSVIGKDFVEAFEFIDENTRFRGIISDKDCGIFSYVGMVPNTEIYWKLPLKQHFIVTNDRMKTNFPGVYAIGDIRVKEFRQIATAVSDGITAGKDVATYLEESEKKIVDE